MPRLPAPPPHFRQLRSRVHCRFPWLSFVVSLVLFDALHVRWLAGTLAGMFSAWARYPRGRVEDAIGRPRHDIE